MKRLNTSPKLCDSNYNLAVRNTHLSLDSGMNLTLAGTFLELLWTKMCEFLSPDNDRIKFLCLIQWLFLLCNRPRSSGGNQTLLRFKKSFWFNPSLENLDCIWEVGGGFWYLLISNSSYSKADGFNPGGDMSFPVPSNCFALNPELGTQPQKTPARQKLFLGRSESGKSQRFILSVCLHLL